MKKANQRGVAAVFLVVVILGSILYGSHRSLNALYQKTSEVFLNGVDADGFSIQSDLNHRVELSFNLATMARKYLPTNSPEVAKVLSDRDALVGAKTPGEKYRANLSLTESTTTLIEAMGALPLSDRDEQYRKRLSADLISANDTISHDPYNERAEAYNKILSAFPANVLHSLTGVPSAQLFA